ncbi:MAG: EAL domain-containing protein [Aquificaceae bacterium]|nr:EAL domain-containing protein [Aquificaceae bacterium]
MLTFSVCPHDTAKGLKKWEQLGKTLEKLLGERVLFQPISEHKEEYERIERNDFFDIYYAGPLVSPVVYKLGYVPVAKYRGQKDEIFVVVREIPKEGEILVAVPFLRPAGIALMSLELSRIKVLLTHNFVEVFHLLKEGKVHAGLMYNETWQQIPPEEKEGLNILHDIVFESSHIFMVRKGLEDRVRSALLSFEDIEPAYEEDVKKAERLFTEFDRFSRLWSDASIAYAVSKSENIGVLVYKEKIVYANSVLLRMIGYERDEIVGKDVYQLIEKILHPRHAENVKNVIKRRLSGESFKMEYGEVPYIKKDGSVVYLLTTSETILYEGEYAGVVFLVDVTKKRRLERAYALLREINQAITQSTLEEEMFERICEALTEETGIKLSWFGFVENPDKGIKPISWSDLEDERFKELLAYTQKMFSDKEKHVGYAYSKDKIWIEENILKSSEDEEYVNRMLEFGFNSSCIIPIKKGGRVLYLLFLYSEEHFFFQEEIKEILYEIKNDIEFALERFENIRQSVLMMEALENTSWVLITDETGKILYANDGACKMSGYKKEELIGSKPSIFKSGYQSEEFYKEMWNRILSGEVFHGTFINRKKNGELFYIEESIYPVKLPGGALRFVSIGRDVTKEVELSSELEKLTFYDPITGLHNFAGFKLKAREVLRDTNSKYALVMVDLYRLSFINKNYGVMVGEEVISEVGKRFREAYPESLMCRVSGDEFALLIGPLEREDEVFSHLELIRSLFDKPFLVGGHELSVSFNAGVSMYPEDGQDVISLYEKAVVSLSEAKELGEGEIGFFGKKIEEKAEKFTKAINLIAKAVEENLFVFYYQPYYRSLDLKLSGFEALVRIRDKNGNLYNPGFFIDELEKSRFLPFFERWSVEEAKRIYEKFRVPISLNISARSFKNQQFLQSLLELNGEFFLIIEITERLFMEDFDRAVDILQRLRNKGLYKVALDDFGTAYSSLSYLSKIPVDVLKIDISFVREMLTDKRINSIVRYLIKLADELGIETLAEGVEREDQLEFLRYSGCTYVQGYLLGKPMPEDDALEIVRRNGNSSDIENN